MGDKCITVQKNYIYVKEKHQTYSSPNKDLKNLYKIKIN